MIAEILISIVVLVLMALVVLRCLRSWGAPVPQLALPGGHTAPGKSFVPTARSLWILFGAMLALRAVMILVQIIWVATQLGGLTPENLETSFTRWDARHYVGLAEEGYGGYVEDGQPLFVVFFPLYVWITRLVSMLLPNTIAAGVLVSSLCFAWGCCYVYRLGGLVTNEKNARYAVVMFACFPYAFFSGLVYTEGLFLLTTAAALYYVLKRKWGWFALWGALAAITRVTGVLLMVPALVIALKDSQFLRPPVRESIKQGFRPFIKAFPFVLMPVLGTVCYLLLNYYVTGDPFAFLYYQLNHWSNEFNWIGSEIPYLWGYAVDTITEANSWAIFVPEVVLFWLMTALLTVSALRKNIPPSLLAYGFAYFFVTYSVSWLISAGRYLSGGIVYFIFAAMLTEDRPLLRQLILIGQSVFLGLNFGLHLMSAQVM